TSQTSTPAWRTSPGCPASASPAASLRPASPSGSNSWAATGARRPSSASRTPTSRRTRLLRDRASSLKDEGGGMKDEGKAEPPFLHPSSLRLHPFALAVSFPPP